MIFNVHPNITPPKTNMDPKNDGFQQESSFPRGPDFR